MRVIKLRRSGICATCGRTLEAGETARWDAGAKITTCVACIDTPDEAPDRGKAGASVAREYQRRSERYQRKEEERVAADRHWRTEVKTQHPVLGRIATAITPRAEIRPEPSYIKSWGTGAPGEERVGEVLNGIGGIVALNDRKVRGGRANIDHIAITPGGVWVIDAKRYVDARVEFHDTGGLLRRDERLLVGGRDRTKLVEGMGWQVEAVSKIVSALLGETDVRAMLCFVGSTWPLLARRPFLVKGVAVCWPLALPAILSRPGPLDQAAIQRIAEVLANALPSA